MADTGRPTKLTPELQEKLIVLIRSGIYPEIAAGALGIGRSTYHEWVQRGRAEHPEREQSEIYRVFAEKIEQAVCEAQVNLCGRLARFIQGKEGTPQQMGAVQWVLQHRFRKEWGPPVPVQNVVFEPNKDDASGGARPTIQIVYSNQPKGDGSEGG